MAVPLYQSKADLLRVLGHPARVRVLELLAEREYAAGELLSEIALEAGSLSQQLAVLRRAGLVNHRREAGCVVYAVAVPEIRAVLAAAGAALAALPGEGEALAADLRAPCTPPAGTVVGAVTRGSLAG
jgi:DNA-binding transcriptional ArsR family regulator